MMCQRWNYVIEEIVQNRIGLEISDGSGLPEPENPTRTRSIFPNPENPNLKNLKILKPKPDETPKLKKISKPCYCS